MVEYNIDFKGYEVDASGRVRTSNILRRFQQIAGDDTAQYGLDYDTMRQDDVVFVLSKVRLRFLENLFCGEKVRLCSFGRLVRGVSFYRDFHVFHEEKKIITASSRWALINYKTRRLERPSVLKKEIENFPDHADGFDVERILLPEGAPLLCRDIRRVYPSMLDQNNHLNNCIYADIATDYLPDPTRPIRELQIDFHKEARLGDELALESFQTERGVFVRGSFCGDGSRCFDAEIITD